MHKKQIVHARDTQHTQHTRSRARTHARTHYDLFLIAYFIDLLTKNKK